jgi:DNA-binding GntR family transcriptional regulator
MEPVANSQILFDVVYDRLLRAIVDCTLLPGQRVLQNDLAASLRVSRAPVSHALQVLKRQGLLQESGRKGLEVAPIQPKRVRDLYHVRASLDGLAARMAAERSATKQMSKSESDLLRDAFEAGNKLGDETTMPKRAEAMEADIAFHIAIYTICGNSAITETLEPILPHVQRAMVLVLEDDASRKQAWNEHKVIMKNILSGRPVEASELAFKHAANAGANIEGLLRESQQIPGGDGRSP